MNSGTEMNCLVFQINYNSQYIQNRPFCISLKKTNTLTDIYQKLENLLFPPLYSEFCYKNPDKTTSIDIFSRTNKNIHSLFVQHECTNKFLIIPNSNKMDIVTFMFNNQEYFQNIAKLPRLYNLFKIHVLDEETYRRFEEENFNNSIIGSAMTRIKKYTKCFA
jgi:hypothetical protein